MTILPIATTPLPPGQVQTQARRRPRDVDAWGDFSEDYGARMFTPARPPTEEEISAVAVSKQK